MENGTLPEGWEEIVIRIARSVAQRLALIKQLARDLIDDARSYIWERRDSYDPARPFESWCYVVLNHRAIDLRRAWGRRRLIDGKTGKADPSNTKGDDEINAVVWEDSRDEIVRRLDGQEKFSSADISRLETQLVPRRRVIALSCAGIWVAAPPESWDRWLSEAGIDPPFPPPCSDDFKERVHVIAEVLGISCAAVRQSFFRARDVLKELDYVRRIRQSL